MFVSQYYLFKNIQMIPLGWEIFSKNHWQPDYIVSMYRYNVNCTVLVIGCEWLVIVELLVQYIACKMTKRSIKVIESWCWYIHSTHSSIPKLNIWGMFRNLIEAIVQYWKIVQFSVCLFTNHTSGDNTSHAVGRFLILGIHILPGKTSPLTL